MRVRVSAVYEQGREVLCMKYVYGGKDVYALPGGGVDRDVPFRDAIKAEWKEELGVKMEVGEVIMLGEAPGDKRRPQTLHVVFWCTEVHGTPKIRADNTRSLDVAWLPVDKLRDCPLYPDVGKQLYDFFQSENRRSIVFIKNCMERGYW